MTAADKYVAGAYLVAFVLVLVYVLFVALRLQRLERALQEPPLSRGVATREPDPELMEPTGSQHGNDTSVEAGSR